MKVGERHFRGRDQKEIVGLTPIHRPFHSRKLACCGQTGTPGQIGGMDLDVAVVFGMEIQHKVNKGPLESCPRALKQCKPPPCDGASPREVQDTQAVPQFPVGEQLELRGMDRSPGSYKAIVRRRMSERGG